MRLPMLDEFKFVMSTGLGSDEFTARDGDPS